MMNFVQEEKGNCNNNNEEDQDEDHQKERIKHPFSVSSSSSSVSSSKYKPFVPHHHHNSWLLGPIDSQEAATNFDNKVDLMDLSLGNNSNNEDQPHRHSSNINNNANVGNGNSSSTTGESSGMYRSIEKEHMFDKVVTPSDVGKLNRLVIPKQHAERYFPLDSSSNEKGLLLNFEDRNGKAWRFRYSYWNSSQSYVMTKGWSRFVKDKKLDAGDIVSFQRGIGELGKDRLYIDWRRRPDVHHVPDPATLAQMQLQNQVRFQQSLRWGTRLYSLPQSLSNYGHFSYNAIHNPYYQHHHHQHQHQQQQQQQILGFGGNPSSTMPVQYYLRPSSVSQQIEGGHMPMVIDSVPVVVPRKTNSSTTAAKRLRLFGVNMDCPIQDDQSPATSSSSTRQAAATEYSNKGKSSLSFDLDL